VILVFVVIAASMAAAVIAFVVTANPRNDASTVDPEAEERAIRRFIARHPRLQAFLKRRFDRASAGGFLLTVAFLATFGVVLVLGLLLRLIHHSQSLENADKSVSQWGFDHASSHAVDVLRWITQLGSTPAVIIMLTAAALYDYRRNRNANVFAFVVAVGLGQLLLNNGIKLLVRRERPAVLHLVGAHGFSFPSGHSCAAAAALSAVALIACRHRSRRVAAICAGLAALGAIAVATSRALLGVHWLSDVIGGLVLGWGWFLLVAAIFGGRRQRLGDPVPAESVKVST